MVTSEDKAADSRSRAHDSVTSQELLGGRRQLEIEHKGERYILRLTANDKLILTK